MSKICKCPKCGIECSYEPYFQRYTCLKCGWMYKPTTNIMHIQHLSPSELAPLLIKSCPEEDIEYDIDEEPYTFGVNEMYKTSDGKCFSDDNYKEALDHEIEWLNAEYEDSQNGL